MYCWLVNGNDFAFLFVVFPRPIPVSFPYFFFFFCLFDKKSVGPAGICAMGGLFCERIDHTPGATGTPFKGETNRPRWRGQRKKKPLLAHTNHCCRKFFLLLFFYAIRGQSLGNGGPLSDGGSKAKWCRAHSLRRAHYHRRDLSRWLKSIVLSRVLRSRLVTLVLGKLYAFPIWQSIVASADREKIAEKLIRTLSFLHLRVEFFTENRLKLLSRREEFHIKTRLTRVGVFSTTFRRNRQKSAILTYGRPSITRVGETVTIHYNSVYRAFTRDRINMCEKEAFALEPGKS